MQSHLAASRRMVDKNTDLNLPTFNFFDDAAVEALDWKGVDRELALPALQARQRLLRVAGNSFASELLSAGGYDAAHAISEHAHDAFADEWKNVFPGGENGSRALHQK